MNEVLFEDTTNPNSARRCKRLSSLLADPTRKEHAHELETGGARDVAELCEPAANEFGAGIRNGSRREIRTCYGESKLAGPCNKSWTSSLESVSQYFDSSAQTGCYCTNPSISISRF